MAAYADIALHKAQGHIIAGVGHENFWLRLTVFLRRLVPFNSWVAMIFEAGRPPDPLAVQDTGDADSARLFPAYLRDLYRLDPFYECALTLGEAGLFRIDDISSETFRRSDYYLHYYRHIVVKDEVQYLVRLDERRVISLSLGARHFLTEAHIGALQAHAPWILPLMVLAVERMRTRDATPASPTLGDALTQRLLAPLTPREHQMAELMRAGQAMQAIARAMNISVHTVKIHRRNVYAKLGVATQAQAIALLASLPLMPDPHPRDASRHGRASLMP